MNDVPGNYTMLGSSRTLRVVQVFVGDMRGWSPPCVKHGPWDSPRRARPCAVATIVDDRTGHSVELCRECCQDVIGFVPGPIGNQYYFGRVVSHLVTDEMRSAVEEVSLDDMRAELAGVKTIAALVVRRKKKLAAASCSDRRAVIGKVKRRGHR